MTLKRYLGHTSHPLDRQVILFFIPADIKLVDNWFDITERIAGAMVLC